MASIIGAETNRPQDYAKVARVIYNRLRVGMKLQMDSTIHYVVGKDGGVFTTPEQRDMDSPYNTYKNKGLPPTPINSPTKDTLRAAINPAQGSWLYFTLINLDTGETAFASTAEEHMAEREEAADLVRGPQGPLLMTRCAVLGSPIAHSLSPAMHRAAYAALGLDWRYDAFEVEEDELRGFVATLGDDVRGLSLTMPLKRVALDLVDTVDPVAELIGAANTMLFEPDGSRSAHNTDVPGLVNAFAEQGITAADTAVVLGGGATAASTLAALRGLKVSEVTSSSGTSPRPSGCGTWRPSSTCGPRSRTSPRSSRSADSICASRRCPVARSTRGPSTSPASRRWCSTWRTTRGRPGSRSRRTGSVQSC